MFQLPILLRRYPVDDNPEEFKAFLAARASTTAHMTRRLEYLDGETSRLRKRVESHVEPDKEENHHV